MGPSKTRSAQGEDKRHTTRAGKEQFRGPVDGYVRVVPKPYNGGVERHIDGISVRKGGGGEGWTIENATFRTKRDMLKGGGW